MGRITMLYVYATVYFVFLCISGAFWMLLGIVVTTVPTLTV